MKDIFEIKKFYTIIFIISLLSLLIALYIEFFLGYSPCKLCIYQRIPYLFAIFLAFLGISYSKNLIWLYALLIVFFSSFILSVFWSLDGVDGPLDSPPFVCPFVLSFVCSIFHLFVRSFVHSFLSVMQ